MKKFITIATVLAISLVAVGSANAQTAEELQSVIAQLQSQIAQLTSQLGTTSTTTGTTSIPAVCSGITFTRNLTIGSRGADVKCLQALLNQDPATQLAATGAGSPGQETDYFGPITKAAVIKFQEKYASEVLTPLGLTKGTGYVGNATIAKLNSILSSISVVPTTPTPTPTPVTGEEEEEEEEEEELSGGEGNIMNWEKLGDPSSEEVKE
ncbi:MAG TPA: peptidoglycan-binding protein, partial [Candidatus Pacearchaeota archaeon]|nr:peptidoglycan-binding protein [Candidatus Pacearchaeota archaeon]